MTVYRKNGTSWQAIANIYRKVGTSWTQIKSVYRKVGTTWVKVFSGLSAPKISKQVEITESSPDGTTALITLTGKNYPWTGADTLTYKFDKSTDGVTFETPALETSTITNPTTSNSKPYLIPANKLTANVANTFRFSVTGVKTSNNATTISSATTVIYGIDDITVTKTGQGITDLTFAWTGGANASGFIYQYQTYVNDVEGTWSSFAYTTSTSVNISSINGNTKYRIRVRGVSGSSTSNQGYLGNWAYQVGTTDAAPEPTVIYYPAILGTPTPGNNLNKYAGSYSNLKSGTSVYTGIYAIASDAVPTQGQDLSGAVLKDGWEIYSPSVPESAYTYLVTQNDATTVSYRFYAVDRVTAIDGTYRYYYSNKLTSYIPTVTDNFNRTVNGGIGQMSSGYYYTGPSTSPSWSVNGSEALSSATPAWGSGPDTWGLRTVELGGDIDRDISIKFPGQIGGLGIAFWATSSNSWWASTANYYSSVETTTSCTGTEITTDSSGTGCGGCATTSTDGTSYTCNGTVIAAISTSDAACHGCTVTTTTTYPCGTAQNYSTLVNTGSSAGDRCGTYTTGETQTCGGAYYTYSNGNLSTACGGKCSCSGPYGGTYGCGAYVYNRSACGGTAGGVYSASTVGLRCGSCFGSYPNYYYQVVEYTPVYYTCQVRSCETYYNYAKRTTSTSYSCSPKENTTTTYKCNPSVSSTATYYKTQIVISSASGSSVYLESDLDVASSTSSYATVWGMKVNLSGNTITASLYSDPGLNNIIGSSLSYTPYLPVRASSNGYSGAGLAKGPTDASVRGDKFDDLSIS